MNTDFRVCINLLRHQKGRKLRRRLGMAGIGYLIGVWAYFTEFYPKGEAPRSDDLIADIEDAAFWDGDPGALIATLAEIGLLDMDDETIAVHNWEEHNAYAAGAEDRSESARKAAQAKWNKTAKPMRPASNPQCDPQPTRSQTAVHAASEPQCDPQTNRNAPSPSPSPSPAPRSETASSTEPEPAVATEEPKKEKRGEEGVLPAALRDALWFS